MDKCGIYKITNVVNQKMLIGLSVTLWHRWAQHKNLLKRGKHHNPHLQSAWNKYGEDNFKFEIILECPRKN